MLRVPSAVTPTTTPSRRRSSSLPWGITAATATAAETPQMATATPATRLCKLGNPSQRPNNKAEPMVMGTQRSEERRVGKECRARGEAQRAKTEEDKQER